MTCPGWLRRRGNALLLAVLILLSLTSLGVISVQLTNTDLMVAGNVARSWQADSIGRAGATHGMFLVGLNPGNYLHEIVLQRMDDNSPDMRLGKMVTAFSTADPDPGNPNDGTQHLPVIDPGGSETAMARINQEAAYDVGAKWISEIQGSPGNQYNIPICHEIFDFNARGGIPSGPQHAADTMNQSNTVVVRNRARGVAGPTKCLLR